MEGREGNEGPRKGRERPKDQMKEQVEGRTKVEELARKGNKGLRKGRTREKKEKTVGIRYKGKEENF